MIRRLINLEWLYPAHLTDIEKQVRLGIVNDILLTLIALFIALWIFIRGASMDSGWEEWRKAMDDYNARQEQEK